MVAIVSEAGYVNESPDASFINKLWAIAPGRRGGRAGPSEPSGAVNGFQSTPVLVAEWPPPRQIGDGTIPSGA